MRTMTKQQQWKLIPPQRDKVTQQQEQQEQQLTLILTHSLSYRKLELSNQFHSLIVILLFLSRKSAYDVRRDRDFWNGVNQRCN